MPLPIPVHSVAGLPNLLLIGAAKAGTSSLAADLAATGSVYLPGCKEPHCLVNGHKSHGTLRIAFRRYYGSGGHRPYRLDASTGYAMRPRHEGVAERAKAVLGQHVKIIYVIRDPVERAKSHHFHVFRSPGCSSNFRHALTQHPEFIDYSRYFFQLRPWLDAFGHDQVHVICFEHYVHLRRKTLTELCEWLRIPPQGNITTGQGWTLNRGDEQRIPYGPLRHLSRMVHSNTCYKLFRDTPIVASLRAKVRPLIPHARPLRPDMPTREDVSYIKDMLRQDHADLAQLFQGTGLPWEI